MTILPLLALAACSDQSLGTFNAAPEALITSHEDGDTVTEAEPTTFRGLVSDSDDAGSSLEATWYADDAVICEAAYADDDGSTECVAALEYGVEKIVLEVRDPQSGAGTASARISVDPTDWPEAEILEPLAEGAYYDDRKITFEGLISDTEDPPEMLSARWTSDLDGELDVEATPGNDGIVTGFGYLSQGEHAVTLHVVDSDGKTAGASVVIAVGPPNSAPTCEIVSPEDAGAGAVDDEVLFQGQVADVDVAADWLSALWSSDRDGELGQVTPATDGAVSLAWSDLTVGTHTITLSVEDELGATCSDTILYTVGTPPEVTIDAPAGGEVYNAGDAVTFTGQVSDAEDAPEALGVAWSSDVDGALSAAAADSSGLTQFSTDALTEGAHAVTLTATDSAGLSAQALVSFTINGLPGAPEVSLSPDPATGADDLTVSIDVPSVDPEGDPVGYSYAWFVDGAPSAASTGSVLPSSATLKDETWRVEVTPNDGSGDGEPGSAEITIGNSVPAISGVTLSPDPAYEGDTLTCSPDSEVDADGDALTFTYAWSVAGATISETDATLTSDWFDRDDAVYCTATPDDGVEIGAVVASNTVTIENSAPSMTGASITPAPAYAGDALTCAGEGYSDPDGDADDSDYAWSVNGASAGGGATWSGALAGGDVVVCTVTPSDGDADGTDVTAEITIANSAPSVSSVAISPDPATAADALTCTWSGFSDPDGDADSSTLSWSVDGGAVGSANPLSGSFSSGDTVTCTVTPSDGADSGDPVSAEIVISNTPPAVDSVTLDPTEPATDDVVTATVSASDDDGDSVSLSYAWYVEGALVYSGGASLDGAAYFDKHEDIYVVVTPSDGEGAGSSLTSDTITAINSPPEAPEIGIEPSDPEAGVDDLICAIDAEATDADGDAISYAFAWDGDGEAHAAGGGAGGDWLGPIATEHDDDTVPLEDTEVGEIWTCAVTPNDGEADGEIATASVTLANSAPSIESVEISPEPATIADSLTCTWSGFSDPNGDADQSTLSWSVDGATVGSANPLSGVFSVGDVVACTVTPWDGANYGDPVSAEITIQNSPPEIDSLTLSPASVYTDDTITATVTTSDVDGDAVSVSYAWYVEGALVYSGGSTLSGAAYFDKHEDVHVVATPSDSSGDGDAVTSSTITVLNSPPEGLDVEISPSDPEGGVEDLLCYVATDATDADNDPISYEFFWSVDGVDYESGGGDSADPWGGPYTTDETGDSVPGHDTIDEEVWTCTVSPDDGEDYGADATAAVTIGADELDYSGDWAVDRTISYNCAFGSVNFNFNNMIVSHLDPDLYITAGSSQPGTMTGTVTGSTFSVTNTLAGLCTETYTMSGTFTSDTTISGTLTASYSGGIWCWDCSYQSWIFNASL